MSSQLSGTPLNLYLGLRSAQDNLATLQSKISGLACKWHIPIMSELIITPILECTRALVGIAEITVGIAFVIFGLSYRIINQESGSIIAWHGVRIIGNGAIDGVIIGVLLITPILGTVFIRSNQSDTYLSSCEDSFIDHSAKMVAARRCCTNSCG